ncbi:hypothetical protein PBY51_004205 [Eleginops maclovinus]|uniref:Uncharacterized protein n=1 Tax=Eleginops maclovinus TaxID=56733 RepID=A0AAN8AT57_ELEMC|nr:hypothetical protein PBY51_004205 [Eleginops maclovinus]
MASVVGYDEKPILCVKMVYRTYLQDTSAPPPPPCQSAHTPGLAAGQTKPWPALALALSRLALTQILWLTLQTCG